MRLLLILENNEDGVVVNNKLLIIGNKNNEEMKQKLHNLNRMFELSVVNYIKNLKKREIYEQK